MTPFLRFWRNLGEKLFGRYYEGPEPPRRLRQIVFLFANSHLAATREDWVKMAAEFAGEAYRTGYIRGLERAERDLHAMPWMQDDPDVLFDALHPGKRGHDDSVLKEPLAIPGDDPPDADQLLAALLGR